MTAPRVHVPELAAGALALAGDSYHYLANVLRLRAGDELSLFDGAGREASARVVRVDGERQSMELLAEAPLPSTAAAPVPVCLLLALLKADKMDLVIQKATELGARLLVPVAAARSVVRLAGDRESGRLERWRRGALSAAKQCGRADTLEIGPVTPLGTAVREAWPDAWKVLLWESAAGEPLRARLPAARPPRVVAAIGPEGGFAPEEVVLAREAGFTVAGLGPRILRAETAALATLAVIGFALGDLG